MSGNNIKNTLIAIICVTIIALVGIFCIGMFGLNGESLKWIIGVSILAVAGLGGYEIREQLKKT